MTDVKVTSLKKGMGLLLAFCLLILFMTGCASQQEIRAKKSLERASATYAQAKANPNVETYAPKELAQAGRIIQAAEETKDFKQMEQLVTWQKRNRELPWPSQKERSLKRR